MRDHRMRFDFVPLDEGSDKAELFGQNELKEEE